VTTSCGSVKVSWVAGVLEPFGRVGACLGVLEIRRNQANSFRGKLGCRRLQRINRRGRAGLEETAYRVLACFIVVNRRNYGGFRVGFVGCSSCQNMNHRRLLSCCCFCVVRGRFQAGIIQAYEWIQSGVMSYKAKVIRRQRERSAGSYKEIRREWSAAMA
jgi:hypothetical protein